jgi:3-dehydroquinate synthase class II
VTVIDKKTLANIYNMNLHDWRIDQVICDYENYQIIIPLSNLISKNQQLKANLIFKEVIYNEITYYELWGKGTYIFSCDVDDDIELISKLEKLKNDEKFCCSRLTNYNSILDEFVSFNISLNSGDTIRILAQQVILNIT